MAKEEAGAQTQNQTEVAVIDSAMNVDFKALEKAEKGRSLNMEYLEMAEGEEIRCIVVGVEQQMIGEGEEKTLKDVIVLYTEKGAKVTASFMLVQTLRNKPEGTPISILFTGTKKIGSGGKKLNNYEVHELSL